MNRLAAIARRRVWVRLRLSGMFLSVFAMVVLVISPATAPATGPVSVMTFATGANSYPSAVTFSPSGELLATANFGDHTLSVFSVGRGGYLTPVGRSPVAVGKGPTSLAFSPSGHLLAEANYTTHGTVWVFSAGKGGRLRRTRILRLTNAPTGVAFSPSGNLLAVTKRGSDFVSVFSVKNGRVLAPVRGGRPYAFAAISVAFNPSGTLLATADLNGGVSVFSVGSTGLLTPVRGSPFPTRTHMHPLHVAFSPSGKVLVVACSGATNKAKGAVLVFSVRSSGRLVRVRQSSLPVVISPESASFDPSGRLLAVANTGGNNVPLFSVGKNGRLTRMDGSPFGLGSDTYPSAVAFSPSGKLLAVTNAGTNRVAMFVLGGPGGATRTAAKSG